MRQSKTFVIHLPVTLQEDRYNGAYSGGKWIAMIGTEQQVEDSGANGDDVSCHRFYLYEPLVGRGATPDLAMDDLRKKLFNEI